MTRLRSRWIPRFPWMTPWRMRSGSIFPQFCASAKTITRRQPGSWESDGRHCGAAWRKNRETNEESAGGAEAVRHKKRFSPIKKISGLLTADFFAGGKEPWAAVTAFWRWRSADPVQDDIWTRSAGHLDALGGEQLGEPLVAEGMAGVLVPDQLQKLALHRLLRGALLAHCPAEKVPQG